MAITTATAIIEDKLMKNQFIYIITQSHTTTTITLVIYTLLKLRDTLTNHNNHILQ